MDPIDYECQLKNKTMYNLKKRNWKNDIPEQLSVENY